MGTTSQLTRLSKGECAVARSGLTGLLDWAATSKLAEKRALVTGGTTGLGLAIAERFLAEGAQVVITGRDHELGGRAEQALGPGAWFIAADAADWTRSPHR